jgi:hypothetical protein
MPVTIRKQCDSNAKHPEHEWYWKNTLRRWCPGRRAEYKPRPTRSGNFYANGGGKGL